MYLLSRGLVRIEMVSMPGYLVIHSPPSQNSQSLYSCPNSVERVLSNKMVGIGIQVVKCAIMTIGGTVVEDCFKSSCWTQHNLATGWRVRWRWRPSTRSRFHSTWVVMASARYVFRRPAGTTIPILSQDPVDWDVHRSRWLDGGGWFAMVSRSLFLDGADSVDPAPRKGAKPSSSRGMQSEGTVRRRTGITVGGLPGGGTTVAVVGADQTCEDRARSGLVGRAVLSLAVKLLRIVSVEGCLDAGEVVVVVVEIELQSQVGRRCVLCRTWSLPDSVCSWSKRRTASGLCHWCLHLVFTQNASVSWHTRAQSWVIEGSSIINCSHLP